jgi:hypothetical protein
MSRPDDGPAVSSPPPGARYGAAASSHRNGLGIVSLILGVVALVTSWLVVGVLFGIAALAVGLAARARVTRGEANNRGIAIAGIALGVVAIAVGLAALGLAAADLLYFRHHVCTSPPGSPPC